MGYYTPPCKEDVDPSELLPICTSQLTLIFFYNNSRPQTFSACWYDKLRKWCLSFFKARYLNLMARPRPNQSTSSETLLLF